MPFENMAETAIEDLERSGYSYCSSHPELAPQLASLRRRRGRVAQVGPVDVIHRTLSRELYERGQRGDFVTLRLEVRLPANRDAVLDSVARHFGA